MEAEVDEMLKGGIVCPIHLENIRCVGPSLLAQKAHENTGLLLEELNHKVNDKCLKHGQLTAFDLPLHPRNGTYVRTLERSTRLHPLHQYNRATSAPSSFNCQGTGTFISLTFYEITVHSDSQPYIAFYLKEHGHFTHECMPFSQEAYLSSDMGQQMHDLITDGICKNFVDDGGLVENSFDEGMKKSCQILYHFN